MSEMPTIEKRAYPFTNADHTDTSVIFEVARDSWPKLVARETEFVREEGDAVVYHGPADPKLYDADDVALMERSETVTVVE